MSSCKVSWKGSACDIVTKAALPLIMVASVVALTTNGAVGAEQIVEASLTQGADMAANLANTTPMASLPR